MDFERRSVTTQIKAEGRKLVGLAAPYDVETELPGFNERIAQGSFDAILRTNPDVILSVNHNPSQILARTTNKTLKLSTSSRGLHFAADLPDTQAARDIHTLVQRGDLNACSFAFKCEPEQQTWSQRSGGTVLRTLTGFSQLQDCSVVTFPAYATGTNVSARGTEVAAETRSALQTFVESSVMSDPVKATSDFVREVLGASWQWDAKAQQRSLADQITLAKLAVEVSELRRAGHNVELRFDERDMPIRVMATTVSHVRSRRQRMIGDLIN